ncbi:MAG: YlbF family regulator [Bacillota bacterium]|nr:YlbF family regulator [Bacillota bacterium]
MSQVIEKAVELADALESCEELLTLRAKEDAVKADPEATTILNHYFEMQHQMYHLQENGREPDAELLEQFNAIQDKMSGNMVIAEYYKSQEALGLLLQKVNGMISKAITGEDPSECSDADCASCAGCH